MNHDPRADYYEYEPKQGGLWYVKTAPPRNYAFELNLKLGAGLNKFGEPNLRVRWAGDLLHERLIKPTKKYKVVWRGVSGQQYIDPLTKEVVRITKDRPAPRGALTTPIFIEHELGRLRWVVERWISDEQLRKEGRDRTCDIHGNAIWKPLDGRGQYDHYFWIQRANGQFRDLDMEVCDAVIAMWRYNRDTSEKQKRLDDIAREAQNQLEARSIWTP